MPIWSLFAQDNQVVLSTYGRGIWTWQFGPEVEPPVVDNLESVARQTGTIKVYPNPTGGMLNIDFNENLLAEKTRMEVYTLSGTKVYAETLNRSAVSNYRIDLSGQPEGTYLLTVKSGDKLFTERIVGR